TAPCSAEQNRAARRCYSRWCIALSQRATLRCLPVFRSLLAAPAAARVRIAMRGEQVGDRVAGGMRAGPVLLLPGRRILGPAPAATGTCGRTGLLGAGMPAGGRRRRGLVGAVPAATARRGQFLAVGVPTRRLRPRTSRAPRTASSPR